MDAGSQQYRHTKIIVTLGPATESEERLSQLIAAGVDMIRLNMAHASREWVAQITSRIRSVSERQNRHVAVMMDVKGPEIRTGDVDNPIDLEPGNLLDFHTSSTGPSDDGVASVSVNYADLSQDVNVGQTVLVDSGLLQLKVLSKDDARLRCEVVTSGRLGSRRHINLPGVHVRLPALTDKDDADLRAGVDAGIDFVALSFVREAADVTALRDRLAELGSSARIIAKIEEQAGVRNMLDIIRASDAIMVARGDLGIEVEFQQLPLIQRELVEACQAEGKPVIIATHLLESMTTSPMPTRAEISDVSNAIRERVDAVMLSGETTTGAYPLESVHVLKKIVQSIEPTVKYRVNDTIKLRTPKAKMLRSACGLAHELGNSGIVVFTRSGFLAYVLGALRPFGVPIFAFTDVESIFRQLLLPWGVEPFLMEFSDDPEQTILNSLEHLREGAWCASGSWIVVITNALANDLVIDTMQLRQID